MTAVLGIDPGYSGSLVLITDNREGRLHRPSDNANHQGRHRPESMERQWRHGVGSQYGLIHTFLEQVGAMNARTGNCEHVNLRSRCWCSRGDIAD